MENKDQNKIFLRKVNILENDSGKSWNNFNLKNNNRSIFQSLIWAEYLKSSSIPFSTYQIYFDETKIGQILVWEEPPNIFKKTSILNPFVNFLTKILGRKVWKDGPVLCQDYFHLQHEIVVELIKKIKQKNILSGQLNFLYQNKWEFYKLKAYNYGKIIINLQKPPDELWQEIHRSAKKNIKKKLDVRFLRLNEFPQYEKMLQEFRKNILKPVPNHVFNKKLLQVFGKNIFFKIAGAFDDDKLIGGLGLWGFNGRLLEVGVARLLNSSLNSVAQDHIKWFIIKNANSWGFQEYDLGGYDPDPNSEKAKNIARFKLKWGGDKFVFTEIKK